MSSNLKSYDVIENGFPTTLRLSDDDARARGLLPAASEGAVYSEDDHALLVATAVDEANTAREAAESQVAYLNAVVAELETELEKSGEANTAREAAESQVADLNAKVAELEAELEKTAAASKAAPPVENKARTAKNKA